MERGIVSEAEAHERADTLNRQPPSGVFFFVEEDATEPEELD